MSPDQALRQKKGGSRNSKRPGLRIVNLAREGSVLVQKECAQGRKEKEKRVAV